MVTKSNMKHVHVSAIKVGRKYLGHVEVCNDGVRLFGLDAKKPNKSKNGAEQYALKLGIAFIKDLEQFKAS